MREENDELEELEDSIDILQEENRRLRQQCAALQQTIWMNANEALRYSQEQLEEHMQERTAYLLATITDLQREIGECQQVEQALRRSEVRYREITDLISDSVYSVRSHADGSIELEWGFTGLERITGYTTDEISIHNWQEIIHPDDQPVVAQQIERLLAGNISEVEYRVLAKDGTIRWLWDRARPVWDETEQRVVRLHGAVSDITERKEAEESLRQSEERLRLVMDATNDGMWDFHIPSGDVYFSPRFQTMLGYAPGELAGHMSTWETLLHPDDKASVLQRLHNYLKTPAPFFEIEFRLQHKDGDWQWILSRGKLIEWDEQGQPVRMIGTHTDITGRKAAEAQLRESQTELARAQQMAGLGSFRHHLGSNEVFLSPNLCRIIGLDDVEIRLSFDNVRQVVHPDDWPMFEATVQQIIRNVGTAAFDVRVFRPDGISITLYEQIEAICDEQGQVVEIFGVAQNITERKAMEYALRESEERYRMLAENMRDVIWTLSSSGRFTYVSPSVYHLRGYTPEEVLNQELHEVLTPASLEMVQRGMQHTRPGDIGQFELEQPCKDGSTVWTESVVGPLLDADDQVTGWIGVSRNISERRRAEAQMRQHAARTEALTSIATCLNAQLDLPSILHAVCLETRHALQVDMVITWLYDEQHDAMVFASESGMPTELVPPIEPVPCAVIDTSVSVRIVFDVTEELTRLPHLDHKVTLGMSSFIRVLIQRDTEIVGMIMGGMVGENRLFTYDEQLLIRGIGDQAAQAITNARLFEEVQQERALLSRRVSERTADLSRSNAELARAVRIKDEFLANMSHELRTPLNAILGMSELIQEGIYGSITTRQQQALTTIQRSGEHLLSLINDILDLSKIESGLIALDIETIAIDTVCHASLQFIKQQALKKHIKVSLHIDANLASVQQDGEHLTQDITTPQVTIQADERRLKQILINLLSNAIKFTPESGKVGLEVSADTEPPIVHFTVWDTGIGIAPADQQRLFQPFVQVDSSLSRVHEGTGLGLALVMHLTELHGGSVTLESEVGTGSRFTVSLPQFEPVNRLMDDAVGHSPSSNALPAHIQRVLIVEDSPGIIEQMTRYLYAIGFNHIYTTDGAEALDLAQKNAPNLILLDILLTEVLGWDVLRQLKADSSTQDIPVLVVSVIDDEVQGMALGAAGYLIKPVTQQRLEAAIHTIFANKGDMATTAMGADAALHSTNPDASSAPLILLAEDNETSIATVCDFLHVRGYEVVVARNGQEAVTYADEQPPALILMDIQMPQLDGLEATRRIRANARLTHVPIIALTALAMKGDRERCLAAGANAYLSKPVRLHELAETIAALLAGEAG